jgi:hypothetical protein
MALQTMTIPPLSIGGQASDCKNHVVVSCGRAVAIWEIAPSSDCWTPCVSDDRFIDLR